MIYTLIVAVLGILFQEMAMIHTLIVAVLGILLYCVNFRLSLIHI